MKIIKQSQELVNFTPDAMQNIEAAGRTCYKSEDKITKDSASKFCRQMVKSGHHSVIEHASASVRFITQRGVTHELVRHRIAAFSQESTRYVKYDGKMEFIEPVWFDGSNPIAEEIWLHSVKSAEEDYLGLLGAGWKAEQAREVLPNSLKTEIVMTCNMREWRHVFNLRCSTKAHPQIRYLMRETLADFKRLWPALFEDINY